MQTGGGDRFADGFFNSKYALVVAPVNEFNPSGIWIVEDLYNDAHD